MNVNTSEESYETITQILDTSTVHSDHVETFVSNNVDERSDYTGVGDDDDTDESEDSNDSDGEDQQNEEKGENGNDNDGPKKDDGIKSREEIKESQTETKEHNPEDDKEWDGIIRDPTDPRHPEYYDSEKWWTTSRYLVRKAAYISKRHILVYKKYDESRSHCYDNSYLLFYKWDDELKLWRKVKGASWEDSTTVAIYYIIKLLAKEVENETTYKPYIKEYTTKKEIWSNRYALKRFFLEYEINRLVEWSKEIHLNSNKVLIPLKNGEVFNRETRNHRDRIYADYFSSDLPSKSFLSLEEAKKSCGIKEAPKKSVLTLDIYDISNNTIINRTGSFTMMKRRNTSFKLVKEESSSHIKKVEE